MYKITHEVVIKTGEGSKREYQLFKKYTSSYNNLISWDWQMSHTDKNELIKAIKMNNTLEPTEYYDDNGELADA